MGLDATIAEHGFLDPNDPVAISFWIISISMVAATVFFLVESTTVNVHWKTSMNVGALVTLVAAVHYFYMREFWVQIRAVQFASESMPQNRCRAQQIASESMQSAAMCPCRIEDILAQAAERHPSRADTATLPTTPRAFDPIPEAPWVWTPTTPSPSPAGSSPSRW